MHELHLQCATYLDDNLSACKCFDIVMYYMLFTSSVTYNLFYSFHKFCYFWFILLILFLHIDYCELASSLFWFIENTQFGLNVIVYIGFEKWEIELKN
jgi:hypothetical protein